MGSLYNFRKAVYILYICTFIAAKRGFAMPLIYILLTRSETIASRLIYTLSDARYTHASIAFDKDLSELYSFGRKYACLPLPAGLRTESLRRGFYQKYADIPCALYAYPVSEAGYLAARREVVRMLEKRSCYQYSILGLLLCRLGIAYHREYKYFCSEFVGEILQRSHALPLPKVPSLMHPMDYMSLPDAVCLYEGNVGCLLRQITASGGMTAGSLRSMDCI